MPTTDETAARTTTRRSLHAVAEHVLAAALHQANGHIGLRRTPGGFGTPVFPFEGGGRQIVVEGTDLVVRDGERERRAPLTTLRAAGQLVGIEPGAPGGVFTPATPLDLDAPLVLDADYARVLADWYAVVDAALDRLHAESVDHEPAITQLWPEHFDLAATIAEVNYGGSPGDDAHELPYLYVGPWKPRPVGGFWNEAFGASRSISDIDTVDDAIAFLRSGRDRLS